MFCAKESCSILPLFVAVPLAGAFLSSLLGKTSSKISDFLGSLVPAILVLLSFSFIGLKEVLVYKMGGWIPPFGIVFVVDGLTVLMLVTVNVVALMSTIFSISYMEKYTDKWKYYTLFLLMLTGMNGAVITGDMFNLFVWLEIGAISSYALVAFGTEGEELEASFKYAVMSSVASLFILVGIGLLYSYTSTLNMADISRTLVAKPNANLINFVFILFLLGFGLKSAIVPFHSWLPDAHPSAPAPISAMLSGVLIKSLGIYALVRIFYNVLGVAGGGRVLLVLGLISMVLGALLAIYQKDLKRLLAYSTISQVGYIVFAFGLGTPLGIFAGLFHLINHAVAKALMFLNAGSVVYATDNVRDLDQLGGLREKMPVTANTSLIGSMSIAGVPPLGGFWSKLVIIFAAVESKHWTGAFVAILVSIVTLAYYLKLQKLVFFGKLPVRWENIKESPVLMCVSMIVLSCICIALGLLLLPQLRSVFLDPAVEVLKNGVGYSMAVFENIK